MLFLRFLQSYIVLWDKYQFVAVSWTFKAPQRALGAGRRFPVTLVQTDQPQMSTGVPEGDIRGDIPLFCGFCMSDTRSDFLFSLSGLPIFTPV
jgi:hypothetical protein